MRATKSFGYCGRKESYGLNGHFGCGNRSMGEELAPAVVPIPLHDSRPGIDLQDFNTLRNQTVAAGESGSDNLRTLENIAAGAIEKQANNIDKLLNAGQDPSAPITARTKLIFFGLGLVAGLWKSRR